MCSRYSQIAARVFSMLWLALSTYVKSLVMRWLAEKLALARGIARVIKICKIFRNSVARVRSKRWLAEWLALLKYVKSLEIRWLALQVNVGSRWLAEWLALSKYVKSLVLRWLAL